jgi:small subunit ribosomal protein S4
MASYHGPKAKVQRRFGEALIPREKYARIIGKRPYPPGDHGKEKQFRSSRRSDYGTQLDEKQKLAFIYNVRERQLRNYFRKAVTMPGRTGGNLLRLLETRLDNVVYRAGFGATIWAARQLVNHGHVTVNGASVNLPSYAVQPGDIISISEKMKRNVHIVEWAESKVSAPAYLNVDAKGLSATLDRLPDQQEVPVTVNVQLVVEFYNRLV